MGKQKLKQRVFNLFLDEIFRLSGEISNDRRIAKDLFLYIFVNVHIHLCECVQEGWVYGIGNIVEDILYRAHIMYVDKSHFKVNGIELPEGM